MMKKNFFHFNFMKNFRIQMFLMFTSISFCANNTRTTSVCPYKEAQIKAVL